jgi:multidrug efflux pump subunit AcrA (membrane-fusion protein)
MPVNPIGISMTNFVMNRFSRSRLFPVAGLLCLAAAASHAQQVEPRGAAVSVLKASRACFNNTVEVSGTVIAREETMVRPERPGLKVADVMADAGDTVTAGQVLARLTPPEGGSINVTAPVAGVIASSTASIGALASGRGEALFSIIARSEYDLVGLVPVEDLGKLAANQTASINIVGVGPVQGVVRRVAPTVEPNSQLGQVFIAITTNRRLLINSSGRATIRTTQSCGLSVPLAAVLYSNAGTVVQVVKSQRIETRRVEIGLMSGGNVEIKGGLSEGDDVVARAGSLLREGDPVRPFVNGAEVK